MSIEEITMWKTSDGALHNSEDKAKVNELDRVRQLIDKLFDNYDKIGIMLSANDRYVLVQSMMPDHSTALSFLFKLYRILK